MKKIKAQRKYSKAHATAKRLGKKVESGEKGVFHKWAVAERKAKKLRKG
jgi:hypothetical protein